MDKKIVLKSIRQLIVIIAASLIMAININTFVSTGGLYHIGKNDRQVEIGNKRPLSKADFVSFIPDKPWHDVILRLH